MTDVTEADLRALREEAEATRDEPMPPEATRPGITRAKVLSVRLNPEEFTELARYADQLEVPASALVRGWILSQLRAEDEESPAATAARIARDAEQLRHQLASGQPATAGKPTRRGRQRSAKYVEPGARRGQLAKAARGGKKVTGSAPRGKRSA